SSASFTASFMLMMRAMVSPPSIGHINVGCQLPGSGQRRGHCPGYGLVNQGRHLGIDGVQLIIRDHARLCDLLAKQLEAIVVFAVVFILARGLVGLGIAFEMPKKAHVLAFK